MSSLIVGFVTIPVAPGGIRRDRLDAIDRARAFDNTYRASVTGNPKRDWLFSTPPVTRALADAYETALGQVAPQLCSGDILGGSQNVVLQSENFGTTWTLINTPTRTPAPLVVGGVTFDLIGDDSAAATEGYAQDISYTGNGVKAVSLFVIQSSATSSVIRLVDNTAGPNRILAALTWSAGLPVLAMTTGTFLGYDAVIPTVFRLKFASTSVTAANNNALHIFPATTAAIAVADTGNIYMGGVQTEDNSVPTPYIKTTTASVQTLSLSCCSEITGWTPVRVGSGHYVVLDFALHEV